MHRHAVSRKKYARRARIGRYVTASPPDGFSPVREGVTVEILPDEPGHLRVQGNDQEILERCEFLQVTGHPVTLITGDSGMRINAQNRGIGKHLTAVIRAPGDVARFYRTKYESLWSEAMPIPAQSPTGGSQPSATSDSG
jgi:hypothetical protein